MTISIGMADQRVADVRCDTDSLIVDLIDGRTISVQLDRYPRLHGATPAQRAHWQVRTGAKIIESGLLG